MLVAKNDFHPKLGRAYRTYRPVGVTCPSECPLLNNGCYAQNGPVAMHSSRSATAPDDWKDKLLQLPPGSKVRYMVSGDLFTDDQPDWDTISGILEVHSNRKDLKGWSYTHGWRRLDASQSRVILALPVPRDLQVHLAEGGLQPAGVVAVPAASVCLQEGRPVQLQDGL
jgi:hypothetical protein